MCKMSGTTPSCPKSRTRNKTGSTQPKSTARDSFRNRGPFYIRRRLQKMQFRLFSFNSLRYPVPYSTTSKLWLSKNSLSTWRLYSKST